MHDKEFLDFDLHRIFKERKDRPDKHMFGAETRAQYVESCSTLRTAPF